MQLCSKPRGARGIEPETFRRRGQLLSRPPTTGPKYGPIGSPGLARPRSATHTRHRGRACAPEATAAPRAERSLVEGPAAHAHGQKCCRAGLAARAARGAGAKQKQVHCKLRRSGERHDVLREVLRGEVGGVAAAGGRASVSLQPTASGVRPSRATMADSTLSESQSKVQE